MKNYFRIVPNVLLHKRVDKYDDEKAIKIVFKRILKYKPDLEHPKTFCEKLQWLKLHDRKDFYTDMADKYKAKDVAKSKGLKVIPLLGVYNSFDEIDFDKLPNQFVLKANHTSGNQVVCYDKKSFDKAKAKKKLDKQMRTDYYLYDREWPYKNIERKIIAEEYVDSLGKLDSVEYKVTCFNGKVRFITVCHGIAHSKHSLRKNDFYDLDFNLLPFTTNFYANSGIDNKKPSFWNKMVEQAEIMAKDTYHLRVDFYDINGELVFGEATFFSRGGYIRFVPPEYDQILGEQLKLPIDK